MEIEMIAIEGLDSALIGTGLRGTSEVLVYDATKAEVLLQNNGFGTDSLHDFLYSVGIDSLGENAPLFVYLDEDISDEFRNEKRGHLSLVH
jgi:hypothetical protein